MNDVELLNVEQVIVGSDMMATPAVTGSKAAEVPALQPIKPDALKCYPCLITFSNSKAKVRHMRKHHAEEYKQELQQTDTVFTCFVCERSFPFSEELSKHQRSHILEEKPFQCAHCKERFENFSELTHHLRQGCTEQLFRCSICSTPFRSLSQLHTHRISLHPHRCGKCRRRFSSEEAVIRHQVVHATDLKECGGPLKRAAAGESTSDETKRVPCEGVAVDNRGNEESCSKRTKQTGHPPERQQAETQLSIPCSAENCDLLFSSVGALREHKKKKHR